MNLLPTPGVTWDEMMNACWRDDVPGCVVEFGEYYSRVLIQDLLLALLKSLRRAFYF